MQVGDIPVLLIIDQDQILYSKEIDYNGRTLPLIGTHLSYMYGYTSTLYHVGAYHEKNGIQKPCAARISLEDLAADFVE